MGVSLSLVLGVVGKVEGVSNGVPGAGIGGVLPLLLMAGVAEILPGSGSNAGWVFSALNVWVVTHVAAHIGCIFGDGILVDISIRKFMKAIRRFHGTDKTLGIMTFVAGTDQEW
jgi:hypothetical protein